MKTKRKWQLFLILSVAILTVYNILPTLFYYTKPLKKPISELEAKKISASTAQRVLKLEEDSKSWIHSFCSLIKVSSPSIESSDQNLIVSFHKASDAAKFRKFLPKAGALIAFPPAQLSLLTKEDSPKEVTVKRKIHINPEKAPFSYAPKGSKLYQDVIFDRAAQIAQALIQSEPAALLRSEDPRALESLAAQINSIIEIPNSQKEAANRLAQSFTHGFKDGSKQINTLIQKLESARDDLKKSGKPNKSLETTFMKAETYLKAHRSLFASGSALPSFNDLKNELMEKEIVHFKEKNPFFSSLKVDWEKNQIELFLHPDVNPGKLRLQLVNELAKINRFTNETPLEAESGYAINLHRYDLSSFLVLNLHELAKAEGEKILELLKEEWNPLHPDLQNLTIVDHKGFEKLSLEKKALSLMIHFSEETNPSLFVAAKGLDQIQKAYELDPEAELAQTFARDLTCLFSIFEKHGYTPFRGAGGEIFFEHKDPYYSFLKATRENFEVYGTQKYATLELSNLEQRLLVENRIDTEIHQDLLKWNDDYQAAQVSPYSSRFDTPKPTKNIFGENLLLTIKKMLRGDKEKVIQWGLDLSGGKTVQIELRDAGGKVIQDENDLKQGMNELYHRVNKMGVSEVAIRKVGNHISLDFPGSQVLSASELIQASSMYFHVVNEKFSSLISPLASVSQRFLQEVWNEALITNQKNSEQINAIAYRHLYGERISEAARILLENGLVLADPNGAHQSDSSSKIAVMPLNESWMGQSHPLMFIFSPYALEGADLSSVQASYDPQKGNFLSFEVKSSSSNKNKISPRTTLEKWTSLYSKDQIAGTALEEYSKGHGWRMAVVLNNTLISAPTLDATIRDSASISGHFTQREIAKLVSDLKAGSLSFTPHILSEKNVSPELGEKDRIQGILATALALVLVIVAMVVFYRFSGIVASFAVLFNLLMLWATLQHVGATLSLAGIAGIILTVGMAVDANVLVFERIKEEFSISKNIKSAIEAGYQKAFSAIVDSNVTTIIAALILLNFNAGPIKGFALTLIIGIVSSMFTALFMTRYYFAGWVEKNKDKALNMAHWIQAKSIDFLKHGKAVFFGAIAIILVGSTFLFLERASILGMDFTGGASLHLELQPREDSQYVEKVKEAFQKKGAHFQDFQVYKLTPSNHLRVLFGKGMEMAERPFHQMKEEPNSPINPKVAWVFEAIEENDLSLKDHSIEALETNWTSMSGQMSDTMRNQAILGLLIAFFCIFIYIAFRFESTFAAASILCVIHDVLITLAVLGILHKLGVGIQIDLNTVAAIMTIVGYSLNDTIIIFDRIREEMRTTKKLSLKEIVNSAINATLSRTTITSGTTLLVLIALVLFGGPSIFNFALVMTIGVVLGTLSSWYIASLLVVYFHKKEEKKAILEG